MFNDIYRYLMGIKRGDSISTVFVNACMENFDILRRKSVYNFVVKLCNSTNDVVTSLLQSCILVEWTLYGVPRNDLPGYYVCIYPLTHFLVTSTNT